MKHLKKYENSDNEKPKVGDFVICDDGLNSNAKKEEIKVNEFLKNNIGVIKFLNPNVHFDYLIEYDIDWSTCGFDQRYFQLREDPPGYRMMNYEDIIYWSKYKKDCEMYLMGYKYNI